MLGYKFVKGYKDDQGLRNSFNALAEKTFGLNFENWYTNGYWNDKYEPYSYRDGDRIIANVSVNKLNLVINGEQKRAIQIGTVMTHPDYRNLGLSASLMNQVMEEYEPLCDILYLFANKTVLNFYPKFGFHPMDEYQFSLKASMISDESSTIERLNGHDEKDRSFIYQFASNRNPVSSIFGVDQTTDLLMFYCTYVFSQDVYYLEQDDVIVIFKQEGSDLHVYDIISRSSADYPSILKQISNKDTNQIIFHFTPDLTISPVINKFNGGLFVKAKEGVKFPQYFKHPLTSQA